MPSLKDLRSRITSVKNTQQITKTMKMVAAAKVRRATEACEAARPYAERIEGVLTTLAKNTDKRGAPLLLAGRENEKTVRVLVFSSDRGLCGGFNGQLLKETTTLIKQLQKDKKKVQLVTLGRKAKDGLKSTYGDLIVDTYDDYTRYVSYASAEEISSKALASMKNGDCDRIVMVYNKFVNMMTQTATTQQLAPFTVEEENSTDTMASVDYEPSEETVLETLLPRNVTVQIFHAMLESNAAEQAARMTAMDNATRNAGDMINDLSLTYNRSRQAAITSELIEIISGAEAL